MNIKVDLNFEQFLTLFGENAVVKKFSRTAKKAIFEQIGLDQKNGMGGGWINWFINAKELTSAEVYERHGKAVNQLGGPLLDLLYENHVALFKKTGIDMTADDGDTVTDISLIEGCHELLVADDEFMRNTVAYINDLLDKPCVILNNGKWLCMWALDEKYSKLE